MQPGYDERLRVPPWWWLAAVLLVAVLAVEAHLGVAVWVDILTVALLGTVAVALLLFVGAAHVAVAADTLAAGRARLPLQFAGEVAVLDRAAMRRLLGPGADPAAFTVVRPWVPGGVRVEVVDPADDTPYWLLSSRHPAELARAIEAARQPA